MFSFYEKRSVASNMQKMCSPDSTPLGAFGASTLAPPAVGSAPPVHIISGYATDRLGSFVSTD